MSLPCRSQPASNQPSAASVNTVMTFHPKHTPTSLETVNEGNNGWRQRQTTTLSMSQSGNEADSQPSCDSQHHTSLPGSLNTLRSFHFISIHPFRPSCTVSKARAAFAISIRSSLMWSNSPKSCFLKVITQM